MKKIITLIIAVVVCTGSFAQRIAHVSEQRVNTVSATQNTPSARTTNHGDTLRNISDVSTRTLYKVGTRDSGYVNGTNFWGDQAFAELYTFNQSDSTIQVIGLQAYFGGVVSPASAQTITFNIWDQGNPQFIATSLYYNGFPNNVQDTLTVPVTQLGIGATADTAKSFLFAAPTSLLGGAFFVGYSISYNFADSAGDTLGLLSSVSGSRALSTIYSIDSVGDTALNEQNATMGSDNVWYDDYTQNDSLLNNLAIYPIVTVGAQLSVKGITRNALTYYGNYPNPADGSTNVKFSLTANTDVTILVTDMAGRTEQTIKEGPLAAGTYTVPVNTASLPSGDHLYLIRTAGGDGIVGKVSVVH